MNRVKRRALSFSEDSDYSNPIIECKQQRFVRRKTTHPVCIELDSPSTIVNTSSVLYSPSHQQQQKEQQQTIPTQKIIRIKMEESTSIKEEEEEVTSKLQVEPTCKSSVSSYSTVHNNNNIDLELKLERIKHYITEQFEKRQQKFLEWSKKRRKSSPPLDEIYEVGFGFLPLDFQIRPKLPTSTFNSNSTYMGNSLFEPISSKNYTSKFKVIPKSSIPHTNEHRVTNTVAATVIEERRKLKEFISTIVTQRLQTNYPEVYKNKELSKQVTRNITKTIADKQEYQKLETVQTHVSEVTSIIDTLLASNKK